MEVSSSTSPYYSFNPVFPDSNMVAPRDMEFPSLNASCWSHRGFGDVFSVESVVPRFVTPGNTYIDSTRSFAQARLYSLLGA